jgi:hypothetical protein
MVTVTARGTVTACTGKRLLSLSLLALVAAWAMSRPLAAQVYPCTEAGLDLALATGGSASFACVSATTVTVSNVKLVARDIVLDGGGLLTVSGGGARQVFSVAAGVNAAFQHLAIVNGNALASSIVLGGNGGAIDIEGATVTISDCTFTGNQGFQGGALYTAGSYVTIDHVVATGNISLTGGAIDISELFDAGAGDEISSTVTISNSSLNSNQGASGGAVELFVGNLTVTDTTMAFNQTEPSANGGAIESFDNLTLINCTFVGNSAGYGGALSLGGNFGVPGVPNTLVQLANVTITGNSASGGFPVTPFGGGISTGGFPVAIQNSIIAGNTDSTAGNPPDDIDAPFTDLGHNLVGGNPHLGPLANNGGPTLTEMPLGGSPAIDGGNPAGCTDFSGHILTADQRGFPRPEGQACDIGAVETDSLFVAQEVPTLSPIGLALLSLALAAAGVRMARRRRRDRCDDVAHTAGELRGATRPGMRLLS